MNTKKFGSENFSDYNPLKVSSQESPTYILKWVSFALLLPISIISFVASFFSGLLFLAIAIFICPPVHNILIWKINFLKKPIARISIIAIICLTASALFISGVLNSSNAQNKKGSFVKKTKENSEPQPSNLDTQPISNLPSEEAIDRMMKSDSNEFWNKLDPEVKHRVYKYIANHDCKSLQMEFNIAGDNADRKHRRGISASENSDLMDFIDAKMSEIGCYK